MQRTLILCLITIVSASIIGAQNPPDYKGPVQSADPNAQAVPRQISGGVLNGKAISLPKPAFPAAARAVGASGAVSVQVLIDENGDVVSASAVSGHPLLRAAAAQAARGAKFSPTQLQGMPVKVSGIITYNFVGPLVPAKLGFTLSFAERSGSFARYSYPASLASQLPEDWIQEKEILNSLTFEKAASGVTKPEVAMPEATADGVGKDDKPAKNSNRYTVKGDVNFTAVPSTQSRNLDAKSVSSLRTLIDLVDTRMSVNESAAWSNDLGKALGILVAEIEEQARLADNIAKIETLTGRPPANLIQSSLDNVKAFVDFARTQSVSVEGRHEIVSRAEALANLRY